ncbi:G patch domain and ankyrin repeat-containing protein 1-like [Diadema antillarum]|uniref:G patch domain and ankyrin repeat-containing protein 1-like n=1 Tax=Diadema antillarum TaxID=105358 RepID=UPI003A868F6E
MAFGLEPVLFVRAKDCNDHVSGNGEHLQPLQTRDDEERGRQAKEFYESIIASEPSQPTPELRNSEQHQQSRKMGNKQLGSFHNSSQKGKAGCSSSSAGSRQGDTSKRLHELLRHCQEGSLCGVKGLLSKGDVSLKHSDQYGWNALMCAAYSGHFRLVRYLTKKDPFLCHHRNKQGQSASDLANLAGHHSIARFLQQCEEGSAATTEVVTGAACSSPSRSNQPYWCDACQVEIRNSASDMHQRSTAHLFSCKHAPKSTLYHIPESNRGYQMLLQDGWDQEMGLGKAGEGNKFPVKTILKRDRRGLGAADTDSKPRITHFKPYDTDAVRRQPKKERKNQVKTNPVNKKTQVRDRDRQKVMEIDFRRSFHLP